MDDAAVFVLFATLVAITEYVPAVVGAVYRPEDEIEPPEADQVTAVLFVPLTVAVNCWVVPSCRDTELGVIETLILRDGFERRSVASTTLFEALSPEHPVLTMISKEVKSTTTTTKYRSREIRMNQPISVARA